MCWVFVAARRLSLLLWQEGAALMLWSTGLVIVACRLSCTAAGGSSWTRDEPVFPVLAGSFLTSGPSGKSHSYVLEGLFWAKRLNTGNSFPNQLFLQILWSVVVSSMGFLRGHGSTTPTQASWVEISPSNPKAINIGIQGSQTRSQRSRHPGLPSPSPGLCSSLGR